MAVGGRSRLGWRKVPVERRVEVAQRTLVPMSTK